MALPLTDYATLDKSPTSFEPQSPLLHSGDRIGASALCWAALGDGALRDSAAFGHLPSRYTRV